MTELLLCYMALVPVPTAWPDMAYNRRETWQLVTATGCQCRRHEPR